MKEQKELTQQIQKTVQLDLPSPGKSQLYTSFVVKPKSSLCRFYLRGICPLPSQSCSFAHGIRDLNFTKFNLQTEDEIKQLYYDFRIQHPINQLDLVISQQNKSYINLFEHQSIKQGKVKISQVNNKQEQVASQGIGHREYEKNRGESNQQNAGKGQVKKEELNVLSYTMNIQYSLEQINQDRGLKIQVRKKFHQNQFKQFLQLIQTAYHPIQGENKEDFRFPHDLLELEYYRVGFNKLMTRIKLAFLLDFLTLSYKGGHFKLVTMMPPQKNRTVTFYLKMESEQKIMAHYLQVYVQIQKRFQTENRPLREQDIRQAMLKSTREWWCIPPITQLLRLKRCTFKQFLVKYILQQDKTGEWVTDQSIQMGRIGEIIKKEIEKKQYCLASEILSVSNRFSRDLIEKYIFNQRKKVEILGTKKQQSEYFILIKFPNIKTEVVTWLSYLKPQNKYKYQFGIKLPILMGEMLQPAVSKLVVDQEVPSSSQRRQFANQLGELEWQKPDLLGDYDVVEINSAEDLLFHKNILLNSSTILGVDLEGSLSDCESGYLSLIQINSFTHRIIYLIDYLTISKCETEEQIQICKQFLTRLFNDSNIIKIIHDSRNDAQCLYYLLGNRKGKETIRSSKLALPKQQLIKLTNIFDTAASEQVIRQLQGSLEYKLTTPGLNEVLEKYGQIKNGLKQKYHSIWAKGIIDPSLQRPMSSEFKQYCSMDVVGLPKVFMAMSKLANPYFLVLISQFHAEWSQRKQSRQQKTHSE